MDSEDLDECHPVLLASVMYADYLNSTPMTDHITRLLKNKRNMKIAPYCYFHTGFMDYEPKIGNELLRQDYIIDNVDLQNEQDIIDNLVPAYRSVLPEGLPICGLIGVPILNPDDPNADPCGDHYISYVFDGKHLYYFDSAIDKNWRNTETAQIVINTFNPTRIIPNKRTFETAGGLSESPYTYIAQNIFCHTWSLWFLYQFIIKRRSMPQIDSLASRGRGDTKNKKNLIRIKKFIFVELIHLLGLEVLMDFSLFDTFRYIIIDDNPNRTENIIKY